ncbi:MAG: L-histidine N(alpha)-methyltransferase [Planctomycetota bacterium]
MTTNTGTGPDTEPVLIDRHPEPADMRAEILEGLEAAGQKSTPAKYLYDARGSELFDTITGLDEYYPTRTELSILEQHGDAISSEVGAGAVVIEPGAGGSLKISKLLSALDQPAGYIPIEISRTHLASLASDIASEFPTIDVVSICADFTQPVEFDDAAPEGRRLVFFPGSTIGNLDSAERHELLKRFAEIMGPTGLLLIGTDLQKPTDVLIPAYDDGEGVTAAFNRNLLFRLNRELDADFAVDRFLHEARYNDEAHRIEMHLVASRDERVKIGGRLIEFKAGESIHTENSHKFTIDSFNMEAVTSGLIPIKTWTDPRSYFALRLYRSS